LKKNHEEKIPLARARLSWEDNVKMDLKEKGGVKGIHLAQDRNQ
jgi:hypothetical protein